MLPIVKCIAVAVACCVSAHVFSLQAVFCTTSRKTPDAALTLISTLVKSRRYNFTSWAIQLNEVTPGLEKKLAPTDCRLRPDQHYTELGEYDKVRAWQTLGDEPRTHQIPRATPSIRGSAVLTIDPRLGEAGLLTCQ